MENKKPAWLQALEAQSWQAELIASGLAIYGSISLGSYLDGLAEWSLYQFNDRVLSILEFVFLYLYGAQAIIIYSFIAHLVLRILWAGFLGLSSAYPEGINIDNKAFADHYLTRLKKEFPSLSEYSLELDKLCSVIFSILCCLALMLISISFWIVVFIAVSEVLSHFIDAQTISYIGYGIIVVFYIFTFFIYYITNGAKKESPFAKKYAYPINKAFGKTMMSLAYRPMTYIMMTIRTNVATATFLIGMILIITLSVFVSIPRYAKVSRYFKADSNFSINDHPDKVRRENYLDEVHRNYLLLPVIQSEVIEKNHLQLFIPGPKREQRFLRAFCGKYNTVDSLSIRENDINRSKFRSDCASRFYTIYIDEVKQAGIEFNYRNHPHNQEQGYQTYIPLNSISVGRHILQIEAEHRNEEEEKRNWFIPFYKTN